MVGVTFNILETPSQELMKQTKDGRSFRKNQKGIHISEGILNEFHGLGIIKCRTLRVFIAKTMLAPHAHHVVIHNLIYCLDPIL